MLFCTVCFGHFAVPARHGDIGVPHEHLHRKHIGTSFYHIDGKGAPEGMNTGIWNAGSTGQTLHYLEHAPIRKLLVSVGQEQRVVWLPVLVPQIHGKCLSCRQAQKDGPVFVALTQHFQRMIP